MLVFCWEEVSFVYFFSLMGRAEWGSNPVCWWLGLYFCPVFCLNEVPCTGCYWQLGDAESCIQVVAFVGVLTIHRWFIMSLNGIKTNTQKWETKDKPQTNGNYKIRQIIIKIMEYTRTHIYRWAKSKQSNRNKVQLIDLANKGSNKLYLPVKNKFN